MRHFAMPQGVTPCNRNAAQQAPLAISRPPQSWPGRRSRCARCCRCV